MDSELLLHDFDDLELQFDEEQQDKGKRPVQEEEEEEEAQSSQPQQQGRGSGGEERSGSDHSDASAAVDVGAGEEPAAPGSPRVSEAGDMTCAICLGGIPLESLAMVKGCDHMYCVTCILRWTLHREEPCCPQCKQPFSYLLTYRTLDGELQDFPTEEPVVLLKRARWFEEHLRFEDRGGASLLEHSRLADQMAWQEHAGDYDLAEDEEIEQYYFSSAAGRARITLGNRRYGEGGFMSAGRRQARPAVERKRSNKMGHAGEHAVVGTPPVHPSTAGARQFTPNAGGGRKSRPTSAGTAAAGAAVGAGSSSGTPGKEVSGADFLGTSPAGSGGLYGSSPSGSGRRARRNARRAALDTGMEAAASSHRTVGFGGHA